MKKEELESALADLKRIEKESTHEIIKKVYKKLIEKIEKLLKTRKK